MNPIQEWLATLGLESYASVFIENDVDVEVLPSLTESDLEKLGVSMGHRKKILAAVSGASVKHATGGDRRQLTVMFCDLVGSTALSEQLDPEDLRGIIRGYQHSASAVIERFDGYIAQYLGDGLLVYFGHPHAHEDDAQRAILAAMGVIEALKDAEYARLSADTALAVRIGIHTGIIVIGEMGGGRKREQLALGDTPNIAARIQGLAEPDTILISDATQKLTAGSFELQDIGLKELKGVRDPLRVWKVVDVTSSATRFEAAKTDLSVFVGRAEERALIDGLWTDAQSGSGRALLLSGEAGIGKSRILEEARHRIRNGRAEVVQFQCSPHHVSTTLFPFRQELGRRLGFSGEETSVSKRKRLEQFMTAELNRPETDVALVATMLAIGNETDAILEMPALKQRQESIRAIVDMLRAIAMRAPTLVLFEDAQWSDQTSIELLAQLIKQLPHTRMLLVVTSRNEFNATWGTSPHIVRRSIGRLDIEQSAVLARRVASHQPLGRDVVDQIVRKADGVPLFVEELTRFMLESDSTHAQGMIPSTLRDLLMARLDRVPLVRNVAQIGAAIGREFSREMIGAVAGMPDPELASALDAFVESGLAFRHHGNGYITYTFKHALVQDTAYDSMLKSRRQELHRAIVHVLKDRYPALLETDPALFAHHATAAGLSEAAIPYWRKAADLSLRRMALAEASYQLTRGLELTSALPPSPDRDRTELPFHALFGTTHMLSKGWGAAEVELAYVRATELCTAVENAEETIWPLWGVAVFYLVRGDMRRAAEIADRIWAVAEETTDRTARLVAHMVLTQVHLYSGRFDRAQWNVDQGRSYYREGSDRSLISLYSTDLLLTLQVHEAILLWLRGEDDAAAALCETKDEFARSLDHPYSLSWTLTWGSIPHLLSGNIDRLLANVERGISIAEEFGFAYTAAIGSMARGWGIAQADPKRLMEGLSLMTTGLDAFRATGSAIVIPFFKTLLADLLGRTGRRQEALHLLDDALLQVQRWGEHWQESEIYRTRGLLLASSGADTDLACATQDLEKALAIAKAQNSVAWTRRAEAAIATHLR